MKESVTIRAAVLTASDSRKASNDTSGVKLSELLQEFGTEVVEAIIVSDDAEKIKDALLLISDRPDVNLILTTGGTGLGPRDNTPEATRSVIEREAPGIAEAIRRETYNKTPMVMLSRGIAGVRNGTLIINLPGSPKAVEECFEVITPVLRHAIDLISGQTNHKD